MRAIAFMPQLQSCRNLHTYANGNLRTREFELETMKAWIVRKYGNPEEMVLGQTAMPKLGEGQEKGGCNGVWRPWRLSR